MKPAYEALPGALLAWYETHKRDLPWRADRQPYHVWLSEIMLQQTRVEAVRGYYARFLAALPTIEDLAQCDPDQLHKLWEGLGYYSRVRNLQKAAQVILEQHQGIFPTEYAAVRALPGIGDYTAGAVCSICFEQPTPAVDGNVLRVCARVFEDFSPITDAKTKREVAQQLARVYPDGKCGAFTQSLMELGATVCVPNGAPKCELCPCSHFCGAFAHETWKKLPVKAEKKARRVEDRTVLILECDGLFAVLKRPNKGLLAGLWQFPDVVGKLNPQEALDQASALGAAPSDLVKAVEKTHIFTHVVWNMQGYYIRCRQTPEDFCWVTREQMAADIALPTAFRQFWEAE